MSTAQQWFTAGGVVMLGIGFTLGSALGLARSKAPSARNLAMAHVETLMLGTMLLALGFAVSVTEFSSTTASIGAVALVAGSFLQAGGAVLNAVQKVDDQFASRSPGLIANTLSSCLTVPGLAIIGVGVLANL